MVGTLRAKRYFCARLPPQIPPHISWSARPHTPQGQPDDDHAVNTFKRPMTHVFHTTGVDGLPVVSLSPGLGSVRLIRCILPRSGGASTPFVQWPPRFRHQRPPEQPLTPRSSRRVASPKHHSTVLRLADSCVCPPRHPRPSAWSRRPARPASRRVPPFGVRPTRQSTWPTSAGRHPGRRQRRHTVR